MPEDDKNHPININRAHLERVRKVMENCTPILKGLSHVIEDHAFEIAELGHAANMTMDRALATLLAETFSKIINHEDREYFIRLFNDFNRINDGAEEGGNAHH